MVRQSPLMGTAREQLGSGLRVTFQHPYAMCGRPPMCQEEMGRKDQRRCCSHVFGLLMSPDHLQQCGRAATGPDEIRLSNTNHYAAIMVAWHRTVLSDMR